MGVEEDKGKEPRSPFVGGGAILSLSPLVSGQARGDMAKRGSVVPSEPTTGCV